MLALAAAGSVLEIGGDIHLIELFFSFILRKVSFLSFLSSCRDTLPGDHFSLCAYGPDEAQQFTGNSRDDLPLVLAGCTQFHIPLVQPVLRLPRNLFRLFGDALLSSAQSVPDTGGTTIAPCGFDDDSAEVRVAGLGDAATPRSPATGILAGYSSAIAPQLSGTVEAGYLAQLGSNGHS